jgi:hypothetical protein
VVCVVCVVGAEELLGSRGRAVVVGGGGFGRLGRVQLVRVARLGVAGAALGGRNVRGRDLGSDAVDAHAGAAARASSRRRHGEGGVVGRGGGSRGRGNGLQWQFLRVGREGGLHGWQWLAMAVQTAAAAGAAAGAEAGAEAERETHRWEEQATTGRADET